MMRGRQFRSLFPLAAFVVVAALLAGVAAVGVAALAQGPRNVDGRSDSSRFVGAEVCQGCHEDQYKAFIQSAHAQTLKREKLEEQGCESCHGPGAAHVEAGDPDKIRRFPATRPEAIQKVCAACHQARLGEAHAKADLACLSCHSAHHYKARKALLVADQDRLCERCHRASVPGRFHL